MSRLLQLPLRLWHRVIAPVLPPACRFHPSCSVYAAEALERHRLHRALGLIVRRVLRCHPFHPGGFDPVPEPEAPVDRAAARSARNSPSGRTGLDPRAHALAPTSTTPERP